MFLKGSRQLKHHNSDLLLGPSRVRKANWCELAHLGNTKHHENSCLVKGGSPEAHDPGPCEDWQPCKGDGYGCHREDGMSKYLAGG